MDLRSILMHLQCELVAERSLVNPLDISWLQYDVLLQLDREHEMLHLSSVSSWGSHARNCLRR